MRRWKNGCAGKLHTAIHVLYWMDEVSLVIAGIMMSKRIYPPDFTKLGISLLSKVSTITGAVSFAV